MFSKLLLAMTLVGVANAQTCANADGAGGGALSCLTNSQADSGATGTACTGACTTAKDNDKCCTANAGYFSDATADANAVTQCTAVTNAATVTCTNASNSVVATCMSGYTADSSGVCKKDATPEPAVPAAPSPSDDHVGHDHSPSAADVSSATTMSPASMLTAMAMLVAYVMH